MSGMSGILMFFSKTNNPKNKGLPDLLRAAFVCAKAKQIQPWTS